MKFIDDYLNSITMYRLLLCGLMIIAGSAIGLSVVGLLDHNWLSLAISAVLLPGVCFVANKVFAYIFGAATNHESALITGLILFCIFLPPQTITQAATLALVGVIAMASKYILTFHKRHIFNPAAIAAVIIGLSGLMYAGWWIATAVMLPIGAIFGLLILRKLHRFTMFSVFLVIALMVVFITSQGDGRTVQQILVDSFVSWPLLFFGAVMLTEPLTTPPTKKWQLMYGGLVGLLLGSRLHVGDFYMTPEIALVLGNLFSFATNSLRRRVPLKLISRQEIAPNTFHFTFQPASPIRHMAGQYAEVTLPLAHADSRGNRRTFTIASSPTEDTVQFGIKMNTPPSAFKKVLNAMNPGGHMSTNHIAGDFVLPNDTNAKLIFIAGGIGITPFRSMLKYLLDTDQTRDIVLFYQVLAPQQIAYRDLITEAAKNGVKAVYVITDKQPADLTDTEYEQGFITPEMIGKHVPDVPERIFYISGPPAMVKNYTKMVRTMHAKGVKTDYFPGY
ncbi:MAG TPA: hypothetical protein VLA88_00300 [Candidatus Saccharimonadales bacterium]|nr:hypothetical protein [Candidatus Saccharimonadales bacterium]